MKASAQDHLSRTLRTVFYDPRVRFSTSFRAQTNFPDMQPISALSTPQVQEPKRTYVFQLDAQLLSACRAASLSCETVDQNTTDHFFSSVAPPCARESAFFAGLLFLLIESAKRVWLCALELRAVSFLLLVYASTALLCAKIEALPDTPFGASCSPAYYDIGGCTDDAFLWSYATYSLLVGVVRKKQGNGRELWKPQVPELPVQCASCPFLPDNDTEFGVIVDRLRALHGLEKACPLSVFQTRMAVQEEVSGHGDFVCHGTAYTPEMGLRSRNEHRQCPGASKHYRSQK